MYLLLGIENALENHLNLFVKIYKYKTMRWSFNQGISQGELYTGSDFDFCDKDLTWFWKNFDIRLENTYDYLGYVFLYSFDLIVTYVIENKVRFVGPFGLFYIDFEMFTDDEFIKHRQRGRMQDIDLIDADFTGYQLTFYYRYSKSDSRYRKINLYLGKKHRKLFLDKVNSGERMYTTKDTDIKYFLPQVYEKFPRLSKRTINKIINRGYYRMYYAIKQQCYMTFRSTTINCSFFIGTFLKTPELQIREYSFRMRQKLMKLAKWRGDKFDNYYYIGISKERMKDWVPLNDKSNRAGWCWIYFENVIARRQLEAVIYNATYIYIFKVKVQKKYTKKWNYKIDKQKFKDAEFVGTGINYKFYPATKHWKELIKEYNEEGNI